MAYTSKRWLPKTSSESREKFIEGYKGCYRRKWKVNSRNYYKPRVRQGCNLSPILFNIYLDNTLQKWKNKAHPRINTRKISINTLLFANDLVLISDKEERLQRSLFQLNEISKECNL
jgi:hypothetical protein